MPRGKHTRCSLCGSAGHYGFLELLWRLKPRGPYTCVVGYACAACRNSLLQFIGQLGAQVQLMDG